MASRLLCVIGAVTVCGLAACPQSVLVQEAKASDCVPPAPPKQMAEWTPPRTKLPATLISAATHLFQLGLADPRECEYREIEPDTYGRGWTWSTPSGPGSSQLRIGQPVPPVKFHGWVLPAAESGERRFAVCWNGAIYPLAAVGAPADLSSDVSAAVKADEEARAAWVKNDSRGSWPFRSVFVRPALNHENVAVFQRSVHPVVATLLLRLGKMELAESVWQQWMRGIEEANVELREDPYLAMADAWTWAVFDQAWQAHLDGDDCLALARAKLLIRAWDGVAVEAKRRGLKPRGEPSEEAESALFLPHLAPARILLTDQERRAANRQRNAAPAANILACHGALDFWETLQSRLAQCPSKAARVAVLIQHLEEACDKIEENGGNMIVKMLIDEGDDAVEPLLNCLESDSRLTRTEFQSFHAQVQHVHMRTVRESALTALKGILQADFPVQGVTRIEADARLTTYFGEEDQGLVEAIHSYWNRWKGLAPPERWYRMLADDSQPDLWLEAAEKIVRDTPVIRADWLLVESRPLPGAARSERRMAGESLRSKTRPSVSELMARRVTGVKERQGQHFAEEPTPLGADTRAMLLCLARWDGKAALPLLKEKMAECRRAILETSRGGEMCAYVARLTLARAAAGDSGALEEYAEWIRGITPDDVEERQRAILMEPLWRYEDKGAYRSTMIGLTEYRLFHERRSPWNPMVRLASEPVTYPEQDDWVCGPLLTSETFRRELAEVLKEKREAGYVETHGMDRIELKSPDGWSGTTSTVPDDPLCPPPGTNTAFRLCDLCAYRLSRLAGAPQCELFWPEGRRDEAVAACSKFLERYGRQFRVPNEPFATNGKSEMTLGVSPFSKWPDNHHVRLAFEVREQTPAWPADEYWSEAVFCLVPEELWPHREYGADARFLHANVRACRLPKLPVAAVWTTLKDYPFVRDDYDDNGQPKKTIAYEQRGTVWQAEELKTDDRWRRYFGFVGRHCIAKVPAEEIDFPWQQFPFTQLGPAFDAAVVPMLGTHREPNPATEWPDVFRLGSPMICKLRVRNHTGVDRPVPMLEESRSGTIALGDGFAFEIQVDYTPYNCLGVSLPGLPPPLPESVDWTQLPWKAVSRKGEAPFQIKRPGRPLLPSEEFDVLTFDLSREFNISHRGSYAVRLNIAEAGKRAGKQSPEEEHDYISFMVAGQQPE